MPGLSSSYPVYAPVEDLNLYLGDTPADGEALLQRASGAIRDITKTAFYGVNEIDGFTPTSQLVADALHDATILTAAAYVAGKIGATETMVSAAGTKSIQSKSLGGRSVTYGANSSADEAREALLRGSIPPEAFSALSAAGLLRTSIDTGGRVALPRLFPPTPGLSGGSAFTNE